MSIIVIIHIPIHIFRPCT